jgi:hypothetical protein
LSRVFTVLLLPANEGAGQGVVVAHEAGVLDTVQQHVGHAQHVRQGLLLHRAQGALHQGLVLRLFHIAFAHVAHGAGQETAGATGRVEQGVAGARVDAVDHERGDRAGRVVFARVAGRLQIVEDLLVDVAEVLAIGQVVEIDLVDAVDDLAHQLAGFHVVVGVLEHVMDDAAAVAGMAAERQHLQRREEVVVDERDQGLAGDAFRIGRPGAPLQAWRDGGDVFSIEELKLLILVVDDLQEEHPAQLADALGVAVDAAVLAHDVLDRFDEGADGHG